MMGYPEILADRVFFTRALRLSGHGSFVRVLTGLYSNRDEARDLCRQLNGKEQYCAVVKLPERAG